MTLLCRSFILLATPLFSLSSAEVTWSGSQDSNWATGANWSGNAAPVTGGTAYFGAGNANSVTVSAAPTAFNRIHFGKGAPSYSILGSGTLALNSAGAGITMEFGAQNQTIGSAVQLGTAGSIKNDSLDGKLLFTGSLNPTTQRDVNLLGLGGGTFSGPMKSNFATVYGGGTWTFTGQNTAISAHSDTFWGGGSRLIFDYRTDNGAKYVAPSLLRLLGANVDIVGNAGGSTVAFTSRLLSYNSGGLVTGSSYGFASNIHATKTDGGSLTVSLGSVEAGSGSTAGYLRLSGDATFTATAFPAQSTSSVVPFILWNDQYAARDSGTGIIGAASLSSVNASTGSMVNSQTLYSVALASGTTSRSASVAGRGVRVDTSGEGVWKINDSFLPGSSVGTSLLFVGAHNFTIQANSLGGASTDTHWINLGNEDAVLTLDGPLGAGTQHRKSGEGTIILANSEGRTVASTVTAAHVGEGMLVFDYSDVMGSAPTGNNVYVQAGATLGLQNNITLKDKTTLNLHGLGVNKGGALLNVTGENTVTGNVLLGITSKIASDKGVLNIKGNINGVANSSIALLFDGSGDTVVDGNIGANVNYGVVKSGTGKLTLTGSNSYQAVTEVAEGRLSLEGGSLAGSVLVKGGAQFEGSGAIDGQIVLSDQSAIAFTLQEADATFFSATGGYLLEDDVDLRLTLSYAATVGDHFLLIADESNPLGVGLFATVNGAAFSPANTFNLTFGGLTYEMQLFYNDTLNNSQLTAMVVGVVPEPSMVLSLGSAAACLFILKSVRRKAS